MSYHPWQDLPYAHGGPAGRGRLRATEQDFRVDEVLGFDPAGHGEHLFLRLRQTGCNTPWVAGRLARWARRPAADVSFAGLKDRHAVTEQWFSVRCPGGRHPDPATLDVPGVEVVGFSLHDRKLRRGALRGNRFAITIRDLAADAALLEERLATVASGGVPNVFGPQRFGRDLGNLRSAEAWFGGGPAPSRAERGYALSAARSLIFNAVAARRVARGDWDTAGAGEPVQLDGRGSWFIADAGDPALPGRLARLEVHPTGPLWGRGQLPGHGPGTALEQSVAAIHGVFATGLEQQGLDQERRALRLPVRELTWSVGRAVLELGFFLPAGAYATAVLRELVDCDETAQRTASST